MDEDPSGATVGLVGGAAVATAVRDAGWTPIEGSAETVLEADPDALLAVGESPLLALARRRPTQPILPVDGPPGVASIPRTGVAEALDALDAGDATTRTHPVLAVVVSGERAGLAVLDATVEAAEVGRISAFTVSAGEKSLGSIRADGVVVATPAGTRGYAARLGAPAVGSGTGVLAVEPIAQFATVRDSWVCPDASVTVAVERDEVPVQVLADDRVVATVGEGEAVSVARVGTFETLVVPGLSATPARRGAELEKL